MCASKLRQKLAIQERLRSGLTPFVWSYILEYENQLNPYQERREAIAPWALLAQTHVIESMALIAQAEAFTKLGLGVYDALHVACAMAVNAQLFITTDDRLIRALRREKLIAALLPQEALAQLEAWYES